MNDAGSELSWERLQSLLVDEESEDIGLVALREVFNHLSAGLVSFFDFLINYLPFDFSFLISDSASALDVLKLLGGWNLSHVHRMEQEFWVRNQELVNIYEKRLGDAGYINFKLGRTNNRGDGMFSNSRMAIESSSFCLFLLGVGRGRRSNGTIFRLR